MKAEWLLQVEGDFCDHLPLFYNPPSNVVELQGAYDFGISDLRHIPGLERAIQTATRGLVECADSLCTRLPGMQGHGELCEALAVLVTSETGIPTSADQVVLTDGGCDGITLAALAACGPSEGVAYAVPAFPYWWVLSHAGVPQTPVLFDDPQDYSVNFGRKIVDVLQKEPRLKAIILNEPHNPLGVAITETSLAELVEYLARRDVFVIMDDVGRGLVSVSPETWWGAGLSPDRIILVDSFTKRFGLPGLRLGFVVTWNPLLSKIRGRVANCRAGVSNISAQLGLCILNEIVSQGLHAVIKREIHTRTDTMVKKLQRELPDYISFIPPTWGMYCLLGCRKLGALLGLPVRSIAECLVSRGVRVMDDRFLYPPGLCADRRDNFLRLSVGAESRVEEGVERLCELLHSLVCGAK
jgi:aspartate/methionine/tyrosine aminotransferase